MAGINLASIQIERGKQKEELDRRLIMSHLAFVDVEAKVTREERIQFSQRKPVLVHTRQENPGDCVTRRVQEVVERELANGRMPA